MKAMELQIGKTVVEIHDDYVNPERTEQILTRIGMIRTKKDTEFEQNPEERKVS